MIRQVLSSCRRALLIKNTRGFFNQNFNPKKDYYAVLGVDKKASDK